MPGISETLLTPTCRHYTSVPRANRQPPSHQHNLAMAAPNKAALGMAIQASGFRRFMYFNRFAVDRDEGFVHIHLGNVNKTNALVDSYCAVISELELALLKKSTMDYLGQQGALLDPPPVWQPPAATVTE